MDASSIIAVGRSKQSQVLALQRRFTNFILEFESRVVGPSDAGVCLLGNSYPGYQQGIFHGPSVTCGPAGAGSVVDYQRGGILKATTASGKNKGWSKVRVKVVYPHIQTWVNGKLVAEATSPTVHTGNLALIGPSLSESGAICKASWRNIKLTDLGNPFADVPKDASYALKTAADMAQWKPARGEDKPIAWEWVNNAMQAKPGSGSIITRFPIRDSRVHMEFMVDDNGKTGQENGNSGVYVQGRYEIQILNSAPRGPLNNECGAIYSIKAPDIAAAWNAGEWQSYDIEYYEPIYENGKKVKNGRITVFHNGTLIHNDVELPRATAAGLDEAAEPGGLYLQDHGHPIRFRNIWVQPLKRKD